MEGGGAAVTQFSSRHNTPRRRPSRRQGQRIAGKRESGSERPGSGIAPSAGASEPHPRPLQGPHDTDDYKKWRAQQDKRNEKNENGAWKSVDASANCVMLTAPAWRSSFFEAKRMVTSALEPSDGIASAESVFGLPRHRGRAES